MSIKARLARLERGGSTADIPVWCETEDEVPATIEAMLADGEINQAQVSRCVFWEMATAPAGAHERALDELDNYRTETE
jgi:hypothetical protein